LASIANKDLGASGRLFLWPKSGISCTRGCLPPREALSSAEILLGHPRAHWRMKVIFPFGSSRPISMLRSSVRPAACNARSSAASGTFCALSTAILR